ncbi:MAG: hypothetical protein HN737_03795 [Desulfobacterales bacterium]|jgi:hypothetical protein|nr:hypothetical protein [Desulfobacterales bacterium]MBT7696516.1 hypothetical protein [Desulfobacterales bacterium]
MLVFKKILKNAGVKNVRKSMVLAGHPGGTVKIGDIVNSDLKKAYDNIYVCDCSVWAKGCRNIC